MTRVVIPRTPPPTEPNVADRMFLSTVLGSGLKWLKRLKTSVLNSGRRRSLIGNDLFTEKLKLTSPGSRIAFVRGAVPNRPNGVCANASVLNQRVHVRWSLGSMEG